jgi:hypothetical protein
MKIVSKIALMLFSLIFASDYCKGQASPFTGPGPVKISNVTIDNQSSTDVYFLFSWINSDCKDIGSQFLPPPTTPPPFPNGGLWYIANPGQSQSFTSPTFFTPPFTTSGYRVAIGTGGLTCNGDYFDLIADQEVYACKPSNVHQLHFSGCSSFGISGAYVTYQLIGNNEYEMTITVTP